MSGTAYTVETIVAKFVAAGEQEIKLQAEIKSADAVFSESLTFLATGLLAGVSANGISAAVKSQPKTVRPFLPSSTSTVLAWGRAGRLLALKGDRPTVDGSPVTGRNVASLIARLGAKSVDDVLRKSTDQQTAYDGLLALKSQSDRRAKSAEADRKTADDQDAFSESAEDDGTGTAGKSGDGSKSDEGPAREMTAADMLSAAHVLIGNAAQSAATWGDSERSIMAAIVDVLSAVPASQVPASV